jgi:FkbM family methyltransferase
MRKHLKFLKPFIFFLLKIISIIFAFIPSFIFEDSLKIRKVRVKYNNLNFTFRNYSKVCNFRAKTFATKEPETLAWIESFPRESTFIDIGANIGIYSIYAALLNNRVISIEPDALNYALLTLNINDNHLTDKIDFYNFACGQDTQLLSIKSNFESWGGAMKTLDHTQNTVETNSFFQQNVVAICLDKFFNIFWRGSLLPDLIFIKIDVDGNEIKIINENSGFLKLQNVVSVLIELDISSPDYKNIINTFTEFNFNLGGVYSCAIVGPEYQNMKNHIFFKNEI